jgi:TolB-like protein/class 3 adenylate cyclase/predicted negative regulator of RcsB-dependent stress response
MDRKLTTIVAIDVVGYSRLMELDEEGTLERLKDTRAKIIDPAIARHAGRTVKLMGDGALLEFSSVVSALQCAVDIQRELGARTGSVGHKNALHLRIGIHLGDVIVEDGDIYGDGVNVASRLESIAEPGGIVLSKQVHDHIGTNVAARFVSLGEQSVKNISRPIHAYRVEVSDEAEPLHVLRFRDFELDTALFELRQAGERIPLEPQVFDLLVFLARNSHRTVTKEEIFAAIWGDRIVSDAALSSQIKAARRAVGDDGASQHTISTVHGRGFRFIATLENRAPAPAGDADGTGDDRGPSAATRKPSVAVLPFLNLNQDSSEDVFADGITEDITTALAKNRWLTVIARNPAFAFRGSKESIRIIGQKLNADYLVTGSVRKAGTRFRITVQVADADTEQSVWSERFDRDKVDIFDLQDEISELVAGRIEAELGLSEQKKAERRPRKNLGAWDLYQLATAEFYKFTPEGNLKCQELLRKVIALDPDLASAHSRLAYAIVLSMVYFDAPYDAAKMDEALAAGERAIKLDDQDANGYFTLGRVRLARCEYDLAIDALEYALELNPCLAVAYCGLGDSLAYEGRLEEAIEQFEKAVHLSPHDPFRWGFFSYRSLAHLFRGEFQDSAVWARRAVQIPNAQYWAWAHLAAALGHLGNESAAQSAVKDLMAMKPGFTLEFAKEHLFYIKRADQMQMYLEGLRKAGVT